MPKSSRAITTRMHMLYLQPFQLLYLLIACSVLFYCPQEIQHLGWLGYLSQADEQRFHKQYVRFATNETIYHCITPECGTPFLLDQPKPDAPDAFRVRCTSCQVDQCCKCGVAWGVHKEMSCAAYKASLEPVDEATKKALGDVVPCPGKCGQGLEKVSGCNVLLCVPCKQYVCALCGAALDSRTVDVKNIGNHSAASMHYHQKGMPCYGAMFMEKKEWEKKLKGGGGGKEDGGGDGGRRRGGRPRLAGQGQAGQQQEQQQQQGRGGFWRWWPGARAGGGEEEGGGENEVGAAGNGVVPPVGLAAAALGRPRRLRLEDEVAERLGRRIGAAKNAEAVEVDAGERGRRGAAREAGLEARPQRFVGRRRRGAIEIGAEEAAAEAARAAEALQEAAVHAAAAKAERRIRQRNDNVREAEQRQARAAEAAERSAKQRAAEKGAQRRIAAVRQGIAARAAAGAAAQGAEQLAEVEVLPMGVGGGEGGRGRRQRSQRPVEVIVLGEEGQAGGDPGVPLALKLGRRPPAVVEAELAGRVTVRGRGEGRGAAGGVEAAAGAAGAAVGWFGGILAPFRGGGGAAAVPRPPLRPGFAALGGVGLAVARGQPPPPPPPPLLPAGAAAAVAADGGVGANVGEAVGDRRQRRVRAGAGVAAEPTLPLPLVPQGLGVRVRVKLRRQPPPLPANAAAGGAEAAAAAVAAPPMPLPPQGLFVPVERVPVAVARRQPPPLPPLIPAGAATAAARAGVAAPAAVAGVAGRAAAAVAAGGVGGGAVGADVGGAVGDRRQRRVRAGDEGRGAAERLAAERVREVRLRAAGERAARGAARARQHEEK